MAISPSDFTAAKTTSTTDSIASTDFVGRCNSLFQVEIGGYLVIEVIKEPFFRLDK